MFNNKIILITGGTGSFGNKFVDIITKNINQKKSLFFQEMNTSKI